MNSFFKYSLVAIASFSLGVMATKFLSPDNYQAAVTPRQKELQKIAIEAQKRPFFPNLEESKKETQKFPPRGQEQSSDSSEQ